MCVACSLFFKDLLKKYTQSDQSFWPLSPHTVTNYNNVVEAGSESDDEDKLHIVEEEGSLADGADCDSTLPDDELPRERCWDRGETRRALIGHIIIIHIKSCKHTPHRPTHRFHSVLWHDPLFCTAEKVQYRNSFNLIFCFKILFS